MLIVWIFYEESIYLTVGIVVTFLILYQCCWAFRKWIRPLNEGYPSPPFRQFLDPHHLKYVYFTIQGVLDRFTFLKGLAGVFLAGFVQISLTQRLVPAYEQPLGVLYVNWSFNVIWVAFFMVLAIKRMHDYDRPTYTALLLWVPGIDGLLILEMILRKGKKRGNPWPENKTKEQ